MRVLTLAVTVALSLPITIRAGASAILPAPRSAPAAPKASLERLALFYSTYLGGSGIDEAKAVAVGPDGDLYVAGDTVSSDFATSAGAYQTNYRGNGDIFIARLDPSTSTPVFVTLLGGSGTDEVYDLAVDAAGAAYVAGRTNNGTFPRTAGIFDNTGAGLWEGFVTKISSDGTHLDFSTFLGGQETDWPQGIAVDDQGVATVVGETTSPDFPTTPEAYDATCGTDGACDVEGTVEKWDVFVTRINATATGLVYSTFVGGSDNDYAYGVTIDGFGRTHLTGVTWSEDFPTTAGAFQQVYSGQSDAYVAVMEPAGNALRYSTYVGDDDADTGYSIAVDRTGDVYVTGMTKAANFPVTAGAFDTTHAGGICGSGSSPYKCRDAFIAKLVPDGSALAYATFIGGSADDYGYGIAVDTVGTAYVTGGTRSDDFPSTPGAYDATFNGHISLLCEDGRVCPDLFLAAISPDGSTLAYSTFIGTKYREWGTDLAMSANGALYLSGVACAGFPTTPTAYDSTHNGSRDSISMIFAAPRVTHSYAPLLIAP